jgi:hypothetical protein
MNGQHDIDSTKWQSMSLFWQMGNIGSEVGRSAKYFTEGKTEEFRSALARAIDLFDVTIAGLQSKKQANVREVLMSKDQYLSQFFSKTPKVDPRLEAYFTQFAIADRLTR